MAITLDLLARLRSLDDLVEFIAELGYTPRPDELGREAQARLGLHGAGTAIERAAILGGHQGLVVYGLQLRGAGHSVVAQTAARLSRAVPGEAQLLFVLDPAAEVLVAAVTQQSATGIRARQLRIPVDKPRAVAAEILSGLAPRPGDDALSLTHRLLDALAGEGLTARFFREFTRLHERAAAALTGMPRASVTERRDLALVLLTRVLFLYFVQAKGWLAGRSDFLPSLLDTALRTGRPFHRSVFEPLCFGALSTPIGARRGPARAFGVPFLNGGLFERHALERRFPAAELPDGTWRELFDELFERFHFTVRERGDDAVDPEMLGRVFEGLMSRDRRRRGGTYFTPRELLRHTVSAALDAALTGTDAGAMRRLRILDPAVGSGAFLLEALTQLEARRALCEPGEPSRQRRRDIVRDNLFGVDHDPMAVRLAELRLWLALVADDDTRWSDVAPLPNLDLQLRQGDSLLSPLDLATGMRAPGVTDRLRAVAERKALYFAASGRDKAALARSIRGDERAIAGATADAAIAAITARLTDVAAAGGRDLFGRRAVRSAGTARRVADWRQRRRELLAVRRRLADHDAVPFFDWDVHFGEVLASGGFDIVLGNPPWVRGEHLPASTRAVLMRRYRTFRPAGAGRGFAHVPDISVAFIERALGLLRPGGILTFVVPAKLLRAGYAARLRAHLREQATVLRLDDRSHATAHGFNATVFPMICVARRGAPDPAARAALTLHGPGGRLDGSATQPDLALEPDDPRAIWPCLPADLLDAVRRALRAGPRLRAHFRPRLGVKTGANDVFLRDPAHADDIPALFRRPALLGRDIAPFRLAPSALMLAALDADGNPLPRVPPEVHAFLGPHVGTLARRTDAGRAPPWTLFRTDLLRTRWAVLWRDIAPRLEAVVLARDVASPVPLNTCYGVAVPDELTGSWLCAWLNSGPLRAIAASLAERASGGVFRFSGATVGLLPLPGQLHGAHVRGLAAIGRAAASGEEYDPDDLDTHALGALALDHGDAASLRHIAAALCRGPGRDR